MSTLKVVGLQNPASGTVNGTLNADGTTTFNGVVTFATGQTFPSSASTSPPGSPSQGSTWYDTGVTPAQLKVWNGSAWVPVSNNQSGTAPTSPTTGQQWTDTSTVPPVLKLWNGSAWVPASVAISNGVAPTSPVTGQLWSDTSTTPATLKAYNGTTWVPVQAAGGGGTVTAVTGTAPIAVATGTTTPVVSITAGTARQLLQTNAGGTAAEFTSNVDIPGTLDVTGVATFDGIASHPLGTAAAPSVTFTGDTDTGFYSPGAGRIGVANNGANTVEVTAAGNVLIGGTLPGTPNISLNAAGTANFVGDIGTGLLFSSGGVGTRINADGSMSIRNDTVSTNAVLNVFKGGTAAGDIKLTLNNDGSANFGSNVLIGGTLPASPNITLSASGQVLVGTSTSVGGEQIQSHSTSSNAIGVGRFSANAFGSEISLYKSRNGTVGSNTVVQSGDNLGNIQWWGADGTGYVVGASIRTEVDGTPGTNDMPGRLVFLTTPDGSAVPVERMRIDSAGRLLVGTSSWSDSFTTAVLQGNAFDGATGPGVLAISRGLAPSSLAAGNAIGDILFTANNAGAFASIICQGDGTAGSNDYPGRLVFSTTPDGSATPVERMRINSNGIIQARNGAGDTLNLYNAVSAGFSSGFIYGVHSSTSAYTGTTSFVVYTNGNVVNTNGSYTTLSDVRLKENIVDAGSQWDDLKAIRIRNWNFKEETGHETHRQIGPIAQELEQVCPGLVFDTPDRDADGNKTGEVTKGVNQSVLYMKAVKALQEAMERIEVLEADMAALKGA